jgi:pyruvate/2-oxoglutarate/acetoin dehydrogenase E1 component
VVPRGDDVAVPFGKARVVAEGGDLTIVAWGWMAVEAETAVAELRDVGIEATLIDPRTLCPMDTQTIVDSVRETGKLLIVEEDWRTCGVGAEIGQRVFEHVFDYLDGPIRRLAVPDIPLSASPALEKAAIPDAARIVAAAMELAE